VDDAARGLIAVAENGAPGEDYNVASGEPVRLLDLAREIASLMGQPELPIVPTGTSFPGDTPRWFGDVSKVRAIGFTPSVTLREGLRHTIATLAPECLHTPA
jgi:nucleoside-diphosphate-sugar epimerase